MIPSPSTYAPTEIAQLFHDDPNDPIVYYEKFNLKEVRQQIDQVGFVIVKGLVAPKQIEAVRDFWIKTFSEIPPQGRVTWSPYLGQHNHIGYSEDSFQTLYRACDFLWNNPLHQGTRDICLRVHALRNLILGEDPFLGMRFTDRRYGIFVTASYYPGNSGHMNVHEDGVAGKKQLLHSLVPITFKGRDYKDGGMVIYTRQNQEVHPEHTLSAGDVVFYDGSLKHGVNRIVPIESSQVGRIQIFPIPTSFTNLEDNAAALSKISTAFFLKSKWAGLKNFARLKLGLSASFR